MSLSQDEKRRILDEIAARHDGVLRPEDVVHEAKDPKHPLHGDFTWDNATAAHAHRIDQARTLIKTVRVVVTTEKRTVEVVHYVRDPRLAADEAGYVGLPRLMTEKDAVNKALAAEFDRALSALRRASDLAAALGVDARVDDIMRRLEELSGELPRLRAVG